MGMAGHHCTGQQPRVTSQWCSTCVERGLTRMRMLGLAVTRLHLAARSGHLPVVQYLCEQGADKEARAEGD